MALASFFKTAIIAIALHTDDSALRRGTHSRTANYSMRLGVRLPIEATHYLSNIGAQRSGCNLTGVE